MIKSNDIHIKWFLILLGFMLFLGVSSQAMESEIQNKSNTIEPSMNIEKKIPPMDTAAPSKFETASFGLG